MPTTRFRVTALARFAMAAAIFAQRSVKTTQRMRHVTSGMPPDGEVADATGQRSERHDEHTGANRHVHLIAEERRQNEQQHHAAARADEATDKSDEDTADDGFDEAFLRRGRRPFALWSF